MKITAITKIKNGVLYEALQLAGWSQSTLAIKSGITPSSIGQYCNLKIVPTSEMKARIIKAFWENGVPFNPEDAWPEGLKSGSFDGKTIHVKTVDIPDEMILQGVDMDALPAGKSEINKTIEQINDVEQAFSVLTPREEKVMRLRFGLDKDGYENTYRTIGNLFDLSVERIRQIEGKALRKLRHNFGVNQ